MENAAESGAAVLEPPLEESPPETAQAPEKKVAKKKAAKKKVAKKKVAKKKVAKKKAARTKGKMVFSQVHSVLTKEGQAHIDQVREKLGALVGRKAPIVIQPLSEVKLDLIPVDHLEMQRCLVSKGIPMGAFVNIIGPEGIGKTTMGYYLAGCAMRYCNARVLTLHWSQKPFLPERALRAMSTDPHNAELLVRAIDTAMVRTFAEMQSYMENWVHEWRKHLPLHIPLFIVADNWSKLLNNSEAKGRVAWGKHGGDDSKVQAKDMSEISNLGHSQYASVMSRFLGFWQRENNVTVVTINDQNDKLQIAAAGSTQSKARNPEDMMSPTNKILHNKTHRGGRALHQHANLELTMASTGMAKGLGENVTGKMVSIRCAKSDFAPDSTVVRAELRSRHELFDRDGYLDPIWHWDKPFAEYLVSQGFFGLELNRGRYTSDELQILGGTEVDVSYAIHSRPDMTHMLGRAMHLKGYDNDATLLQRNMESQAADPESWAEEDANEDTEEEFEESYE